MNTLHLKRTSTKQLVIVFFQAFTLTSFSLRSSWLFSYTYIATLDKGYYTTELRPAGMHSLLMCLSLSYKPSATAAIDCPRKRNLYCCLWENKVVRFVVATAAVFSINPILVRWSEELFTKRETGNSHASRWDLVKKQKLLNAVCAEISTISNRIRCQNSQWNCEWFVRSSPLVAHFLSRSQTLCQYS